MPRRPRLTKSERKEMTLKHVKHLLAEGDKVYSKSPDIAHAYAKEARRAAMKVNLTLPSELKRRICRKCEHFLVPGKNCRVRTTGHNVVSSCLDCGNISRFGYLREQKARKI